MAELLLLSAVAAQEFPAVGPFRLVQERREWADAEARCVSIGGQLAKLTRSVLYRYALPASCGLYVPEAQGSLAALAADYCAYAVNVPRALPPQATSQASTTRRSKPQ